VPALTQPRRPDRGRRAAAGDAAPRDVAVFLPRAGPDLGRVASETEAGFLLRRTACACDPCVSSAPEVARSIGAGARGGTMTVTRLIRLGSLAIVAMAASAIVVAQDVGYNAMPGVDFTKFKTYKWVFADNAQKPDQITDSMITQAIDAELSKKGLQKTTAENADLFVTYQVAVDEQKEWYAYNMGGYPWGYGMGGGMTTATESTIQVGMVRLDMYDPATKQLVWRGTASKTIDPKAKPEKRQSNINKAAEKMLKNFPPPVKKK
jgi:hypothetical protein